MAIADTQSLLKIIGHEALEVLIQRFGGLGVYIPESTPFSGELAVLPLEAQKALALRFGGTEVYIPKCDHKLRLSLYRQIQKDRLNGAKIKDLVRKYHFSERWICEILRRDLDDSSDDPQLKLF
jgi:hypothetical protein